MHKPRRTGLMRMTRYLNHLYWGCGWNHLGPYSLHGYYHCPLPKGGVGEIIREPASDCRDQRRGGNAKERLQHEETYDPDDPPLLPPEPPREPPPPPPPRPPPPPPPLRFQSSSGAAAVASRSLFLCCTGLTVVSSAEGGTTRAPMAASLRSAAARKKDVSFMTMAGVEKLAVS